VKQIYTGKMPFLSGSQPVNSVKVLRIELSSA